METRYAIESGGHFEKLALFFDGFKSACTSYEYAKDDASRTRAVNERLSWQKAIEAELRLIAKLGAIYAVKEPLPEPRDF